MSFLKVSKVLLYLVPFSLLIITPSTFFPFIVGKSTAFKLIIDLALIFLIWALARGELKINFKTLLNPLFISIAIFIFIFLMAGFLGIDPAFSFWSNFERGEGGFQMLHYFIFFALLVLVFKEEKDWRRFFLILLGVTILMIFYGIAAALNIRGFLGPGICDRFSGTLGNPAFLGTYLIFSLFYAGYLLVKEEKKNKKYLWLGLLVFLCFFLLLTQTRGAFMGLGVGLIAGLFYLTIILPSGGLRKIVFGLGIFLILFAVLIIGFRPANLNPIPFCKSASRLFEISIYDPSSQPRLWTWGSAIKGFKERPIFGWGPENFPVVFDKYFDPRHYVPGANSETWFDRAHSIFLDYLVATGILGLLSYLSIFGVFYWQFIKKTLINTNRKPIYTDKKSVSISQNPYQSAWQSALLFALPIAYLVQGLVLFEVLPIYINFFAFLAFANFKSFTK
jgi:O-antigen ligase